MFEGSKLNLDDWRVEKIAVVGAGVVGLPMAALLAHAEVRQGSDVPAGVVVIQRNSPTSGWKVDALNWGKSPIGGLEPDLAGIISGATARGRLRASHDFSEVRDADVMLICVQTDKDGFRPDYGPLFEAIDRMAVEIRRDSQLRIPLVIIESTLAPSSLTTLIQERFARFGLRDGKNMILGNSPNRVMPGRLVERIVCADKIAGGLKSLAPRLIARLYSHIVTKGRLHLTNSLTAEIVKTLENTLRDVRIAYSVEIARYCDLHNIEFYAVRDVVNARLSASDGASSDPNVVPTGGILIPTIGVGGHCLPKDGILLLWRMIESGVDVTASVILEARRINDESPVEAVRRIEERFHPAPGMRLALLGIAYRFNSEDTRNSPALVLAQEFLRRGYNISLHDPYVRPDDPNLAKFGLSHLFSRDLDESLRSAGVLVFCTAHHTYLSDIDRMLSSAHKLEGVYDGCNLFARARFQAAGIPYAGIGRGRNRPAPSFLDFVEAGYRVMEKGFANEILELIEFLNSKYAADDFGRVRFSEVQRLARTCVTGCDLVDPGEISGIPVHEGFRSRLAQRAHSAFPRNKDKTGPGFE
jgi:UDP-N-acetyl-D-mannosaminuronic acid dehydrogenase